jgi:aspartyl-tRNA(Asn)/glutamyl-tRNA(Gln) amidotransferase subunit B
VQETRGWNDDTQTTTSQRSKEDAQDYRYMPDADIPPIVLTDEEVERIQAEVPKLPPQYREEFAALVVDGSVIAKIMALREYAELVSSVLTEGGVSAAKRVANWIASSLAAEDEGREDTLPEVVDLIALADMVEKAEITSNAATELFNALMGGATDPRALAAERNLLQVSDEGAIAAIVDEVLADPASAKAVEDIRNGNDKAIGFLVGQIMKKSQGKANPALAQKLIRERL